MIANLYETGYKDHISIKLPTEFEYKVNLNFLKRQRDNFLYQIEQEKITRIITVDGETFFVQISSHNNAYLTVKLLLSSTPTITEKHRHLIAQFISDWFDLNRDISSFYKLAKEDCLLRHLVTSNYGLRNIGIPDLFEALCWAVIGQQVNLKFAGRLKREFVESFGKSIEYNGTSYWTFPSYKKIAALSKQQLSHIKMTERKKEYIIGIAQEMANNKLTKEKLIGLGDPKLIEKELTKIHGVGPWTAHYVLMRCLRYPTVFPIDDVGLINAIKHVKKLKQKPTKQQIEELFYQWKNWEGYAAFYLWQSLY